jgi:hypothetical protein
VINPPRRSVTRFFIPLIDVLILLFCIFLLMPFVSGTPGADQPDAAPAPKKDALPADVRELQTALAEARDRVRRMELAAQAGLADRISVRVLQVGKDRDAVYLYYYDPDRQEIRTEADALKLIARQKTIATRAGGVRDVMFLVLYPRTETGEATGYPTKPDEDRFRRWFGDSPLKFQ